MLQTKPPAAPEATRDATHPAPFRPDIQGLRAVAVLSVVLYHAGLPWLSGGFVGVDVFFVISGFLITGGILKEISDTGDVSLTQFYLRRVARILPAATVAILATVAATWLLLPVTRWGSVAKDAAASSLYVVNWMFARDSVSYAALDQAPSPLQHMWSLAVEEQFYIVWPVLLFLLVRLTRRAAGRSRPGPMVPVLLIAVPSLLWSVWYTAVSPSAAYFVTTTRMWELAIGAGLAVVLGRRRPARRSTPRHARAIAAVGSWCGLLAILVAVATYSDATPFPSYRALLPTVGAALLIWGTPTAGRTGPGRLLTTGPMIEIGALSYSLYLWHWPMLVIAGGVAGPLSPAAGLLVAVAALVPAWASTRFVERPVQRALRSHFEAVGKPVRRLAPGLAFTAAGLAAAVVLAQAVPSSRPPDISGPVGATVLARGGTISVVDHARVLVPAVTGAADDVPIINRNGCMLDHRTTRPKLCSYGAVHSDKVIALIGDSHAAMYEPALDVVARRAGYRLDTYTKGSCPPVDLPIDFEGRNYEGCPVWARNLMDHLVSSRPALVITAMSRAEVPFGSSQDPVGAVADALATEWRRLQAAGIRVAAFRDIPRPGFLVPDCVAAHGDDLSACARPLSEILPDDDQVTRAAKADPQASVLDLTSALCSDMCPAVINHVIVYRDDSHLTATYARTMVPFLARQVLPLLE